MTRKEVKAVDVNFRDIDKRIDDIKRKGAAIYPGVSPEIYIILVDIEDLTKRHDELAKRAKDELFSLPACTIEETGKYLGACVEEYDNLMNDIKELETVTDTLVRKRNAISRKFIELGM